MPTNPISIKATATPKASASRIIMLIRALS
jgi:hypothetical protein